MPHFSSDSCFILFKNLEISFASNIFKIFFKVVLYHCDIPVIVVEQRTTLYVAKLLFESIVGQGKIIGLRQRQKSPALACIITQDQTILTEREYEIILNGKFVCSNMHFPITEETK